jgi:hypothetical protein
MEFPEVYRVSYSKAPESFSGFCHILGDDKGLERPEDFKMKVVSR